MANTTPLLDAITALRRYGVVPDAASAIDRGELVARLNAAVADEVGEYRESRNPDVLPELEAHLERHVDAVARLLRLERDFTFGFVSDYAHRSASRKFPLDAILRAYRCVNRLLADAVRDAAIAVASEDAELRRVVAATAAFVIEYTSAAGSTATTEYVAETRRIAETEGDRRAELLNLLVNGYDESDARAAALLRRAGYLEQRQAYCVAIVTSRSPSEMEDTARVSRIETAVDAALSNTPLRRLIGVRDDRVVVVLSATARQSGYTRPHTVASELALTPLRTLGPAVFCGLSGDVPSTAHIPRALAEAERALEFASLSRRVVEASRIPFFDMIAHLARAHARPVLPAWTAELARADRGGADAFLTKPFRPAFSTTPWRCERRFGNP